LKYLSEKKDTLQEWLKKIEENGGAEISTVDYDAHLMHTNGDGRPLDACYNVQTVVDSKHKLIVDFEVTTCPDEKGALLTMTESAKEIMGVEEISVAADKGYYDGEDIKKCEANGTVCYIPKTADYAHAPDENYDKRNFKYDARNDCYICPENVILSLAKMRTEGGEVTRKEYRNTKACESCQNRSKCTVAKKSGRTITRTVEQDCLDKVNARMKTNEAREIFRERKKIVEHPFGTTKAVWEFKQFLCRGQEKTTSETSLVFLAYNFRRVVNIFKKNDKKLIESMT
jgi:hypothetical protein